MVRQEIDPYLDRLYNSNVRCPYCHAKILKYTTTCTRCGIHKKQIFDSSNQKAKQIMKDKTGEKIFLIRRIPNDVTFTKTVILALFLGFAGAHCFYVGRKIRGWIIAVSTIIGCIGVFAPQSWRNVFSGDLILDIPLVFPTDIFVLVFIIMWAYDFIGIVFNFFKYPVRLGEKELAKK